MRAIFRLFGVAQPVFKSRARYRPPPPRKVPCGECMPDILEKRPARRQAF
jgi:hypothetical protein